MDKPTSPCNTELDSLEIVVSLETVQAAASCDYHDAVVIVLLPSAQTLGQLWIRFAAFVSEDGGLQA